MKNLKTLDIYTIPLWFLIPSVVILRTFALFTSFNTATMHFDDKLAIMVSSALILIGVLGFLTYMFLGEKEGDLISKTDNAASYIPAGITSTALLFLGVYNFRSSSLIYPEGIISTVSLVTGILAFLSVASFFLSIFIERRDNLYKAAFSLSVVFFLALYAILLYFNKAQHPTNSPNRLIDELAYLSAALFFLFEARIPLGRAKWRAYISFGLIATLLCSYSAVPCLIYYLVNGYMISESIYETVLTLALAIFICSKVLQTRSLTPAGECSAAKGISALAMMREEEMKLSRAQDSNNEGNDDAEDASNYTFDIPEADASADPTPEGADKDTTQN